MKIVVICLPLEFFCYKMLCSFQLVFHSLTLLYTVKNIISRICTCNLLTFKIHCENINCGNSWDLLTFRILLLRNVMQFSTCSSLSHFAIHWHTHTYTVPVGLWHYSYVHCSNSTKVPSKLSVTVKLRVQGVLVLGNFITGPTKSSQKLVKIRFKFMSETYTETNHGHNFKTNITDE